MARLDLLAAGVAVATKRKVSFDHDRTLTIGASEIALCAHRIGLRKSGTAPDPDYVDDPGFAERGNLVEDHWYVPTMHEVAAAAKTEFIWAGQEHQTSIIAEKRYASCTPDGLLVKVPRDFLAGLGVKGYTGPVLGECKSIDPRIAPNKLPKVAHPEQAHFGLGLVRWATEYKPEYALLTYFNCSKLTESFPFAVKFSEEKFKAQLRRAKKLKTTPVDKLPKEGFIGGKYECKSCEFAARCLGSRRDHAPDKRKPEKTLITFD